MVRPNMISRNISIEKGLLFYSSGEMATIHSNIRRMKEQGTGCRNVIVPQLVKPLAITCGLMFFLR